MFQTLGVIAVCTGLCELMYRHVDLADLIMVYLAGVVFVALRVGLAASIATTVVSIFLFDLIYVPPRWSLNPTNKQHFVTFAVMLVVGLLISRLAARARQQALLAEGRARRAQALNELARQLAAARSEQGVAEEVSAAVQRLFDEPCALLLAQDDGPLRDGQGFFTRGGLRDPAGERAAAQQAFEQDCGIGPGTARPAAGQALYLPLHGTGVQLGVLAVLPPGAVPPASEELDMLKSFADQAALALERAAFERKSTAALVEAETERLRNTLLAGISHDFRTPLTTIVGSATSLLQQGRQLDDAQRDTLAQSILGEAHRMHALMSDLLDLTRMEEGAVRPSHEWCPADELVEEARAALAPRLGSHRLDVDIPTDAVVWCDPRLTGQALVNLLDNAVRHTPAGSRIEVSVRLSPGQWDLAVADNGPGLPSGHERDVLKKFYRGLREPAGAGTGLGLAICAAVARLHGGSIDAVNDGGARFVLHFPQPDSHVPPWEESSA